MTETQIKNKIRDYCCKIGAFYMKWSDRFTIGAPDMVVVYKGRVLFIELKTPTGPVRPMQNWHISKIKEHGGEAYICRSLEEFKLMLHKNDTMPE